MTLIIFVMFALLVGMTIGHALGRSSGLKRGLKAGRSEAIAELEDPKPICACNHNYAFHDEKGKCHGTTWSKSGKGDPILSPGGTYVVAYKSTGGSKEVPCACQRYTGPEPLPRYTAGI